MFLFCSRQAITFPAHLENFSSFFPITSALDRMCPMKVHMLTPKPQGDGVRRWGLWEVTGYKGGALLSGTNVLIKETLESSLTPLPGEDAERR